jgi:glycerol-3-phosphate dehydrogenase
VTGLLKRDGKVCGVRARDAEGANVLECRAKVVVNATGIFSDSLRCIDDPRANPVIAVSQGSHLVLPREFLPGDSALMIPRTSDGRVLFAIPWHGRVVVGTTDDPVPRPEYDPHALPAERRFLLEHIERYLGQRPRDIDVSSVWSGQRPLVRPADAANTAAISRDHTILVAPSKLVTITGGKWTTYRRMAQDVIDRGAPLAALPPVESRTAELRLHGWSAEPQTCNDWEQVYGADLPLLRRLPEENTELGEYLHPRLPFRKAEVVWAARHEMARTVDDVLARRTRALFLDAAASMEAATATAQLMAQELGRNESWAAAEVDSFRKLAQGYIWNDA